MDNKINKYLFEKDDFVKNYDKLKSSRKMAELYGCAKSTILSYAKSINYTNKYPGKLSEQQKNEIILAYDTCTSNELAEKYNVSRGQITKIWYDEQLYGKDRHKYPFNYNYFESIDSPDKAYFLGLLAADGNVLKRTSSSTQAITRISLQQSDKQILEMFKIYLDSQQPLYRTERISNNYTNYMYSLELVSDKLANDLSKYNIVPQKTYGYEMIELNENLMSHYFRGYFDGDGSILCSNNTYHTPSQYDVTISGFVHNLEKMQQYLYQHDIKTTIAIDNREIKKNKYNLPFGNLRFDNIDNKYKFIQYIYQDKRDIYIARKKYLSNCFINAIQQNYSNRQNIYNNILMPS